jgi:curved DNA-binding protein
VKFKDYYASLGLDRDATESDIKSAYRKLAHKYHPDISKEPGAEVNFKEVSEAYKTLKDPEKRAAYDRLGKHAPGEEMRPPPDWQARDSGSGESFEDLDLADLFAGLARGKAGSAGRGSSLSFPGEDYDVRADITIEQAYHGTQLEFSLNMPELNAEGRAVNMPRTLKVRIPKGATDGKRLRLAGQGGRGFGGGRNGDLYVTIGLKPHRLYRPSGHDLFLDLPLSPWEAALGSSVSVPTPGGPVQLKIPSGTSAGKSFRLAGRGLPQPHQGAGDLLAVTRIVMPQQVTDRERELLKELAAASSFEPRADLMEEGK